MSEKPQVAASPAVEIDREHSELLEFLRQAVSAYRAGDSGGGLLAMGALRARTVSHFANEQRLMEATGYPGRADHEEAHRAFTADLDGLIAQAARGAAAAAVVLWLESRVSAWVTLHLRGKDAALLEHLAAHASPQADEGQSGTAAGKEVSRAP